MGAEFKLRFSVQGVQQAVNGINRARAATDELTSSKGKRGLAEAMKAATDRLRELVSAAPGGQALVSILGAIGTKALFVAGAIFGAFRALRDTITRAQALSDFAAKLQITTQRVEALRYASRALGEDFGNVERVLGDIRERQGQALRGNQELRTAFQALGVSMADLKALAADEIMLRISAGMQSGKVSAREFEAAIRAMGEGGKNLGAFLQKDIAGLVSEFEKSGNAMKSAYVNAFAGIGDFWDATTARMGATFKGFANNMREGVFELADDFAQGIALITGDMETLQELQTREILRRDPDFQAGQENARRLENRLRQQEEGRQPDPALQREGESRQDKEARHRLDLEKQIEQARFDALDADSQRLELLEKIKREEQVIALLRAEGGTETELLEAIVRINNLQKQLSQADSKAEKENATPKFKASATNADQLARIGGFRGGQVENSAQAVEAIKDIRGDIKDVKGDIRTVRNIVGGAL